MYKKLSLIITVLLITLKSFSQIHISTYRNTAGVSKDSVGKQLDKIKFLEFIYAEINFIVNESCIVVNDSSKSFYTIIENLPIEEDKLKKCLNFNCIDEQNRPCVFSIINNKIDKSSYIMVTYEKVTYIYSINKMW